MNYEDDENEDYDAVDLPATAILVDAEGDAEECYLVELPRPRRGEGEAPVPHIYTYRSMRTHQTPREVPFAATELGLREWLHETGAY